MRLIVPLLALIVALLFATACAGSASGGAGGASPSAGTAGSKPVIKKDGGAKDDAGPDIESTSAGW